MEARVRFRCTTNLGFVKRIRLPGEPVLIRDVYRSRVRSAVPMLVVEHTADRVVLLLKRDTPFCLPVDRDGGLTKDVVGFHRLTELRWTNPDQLVIAPSGMSHAVIIGWATSPEHQQVDWYVNLQAPLRETPLGWDTTDYALDVVISADLETVTCKDEEQLAELVRFGYFSEDEAAAFRREGERVIAAAHVGEAPFSERWEHWRPDESWRVPGLPPRWQSV